jgi:hypothetical protein
MEIHSSRKWAAVCVSILAMTASLKLSADPAATVSQSGETNAGIITAIDLKDHMLDVKNKKFNLSDTCTCTIVGKDNGSLDDLRQGQRVVVSYHHITNAVAVDRTQQELRTSDLRSGGQRIQINNYFYTNDLLVADHVQQELMTCNAIVRTNDLTEHTLTLRFVLLNQAFQVPDDCKVTLHDGRSGSIADIQSGNYVEVTYETPGDADVAHEIVQTNTTFMGKLMTVNPTNRTITAATLFDTRELHPADDCVIILSGKTNAQLSDLKLYGKFVFSYNYIDGVNLVSLITTNIPPPHVLGDEALRKQALTPRMRGQSLPALSPRMQGMK